jgi:class 3 adenylate cyclase/tetratricopeptide (TPR) repeat protein
MEGNKMKCPSCQFENNEEAKFCKECGAKLALFCPNCESILKPDCKFCEECGYKLSLPLEQAPKELSYDEKLEKIQRYLPRGLTEKILSQRGKIEGERKHVTVMFCDMVGFTQLSERVGSEDAYSVMDQVYEILIHIVHDHEGTVNEFTGDGIMALFGAPIALEDAPQKSIRAALSIHQEIAKFNEQIKLARPIHMRIGIHTGPVVVGTLGNDLRVEFKAVGDTVNLASRMEKLAESGITYVTQETFQLTRTLFRFENLGEKTIKGIEKPVTAYKLLSAKKGLYRARLGSERILYSEMIGRDNELSKLELQVMKAINGEGSIVNIVGEAGIGKSRLMAELKQRDVMERVTFIEGRAISMGRNLSFHPIIDLLKNWTQINEDDRKAAAFDKLKNSVMNVHPEKGEEVTTFIATLMGMKLSGRYAERVKGIRGEALQKMILKNVRELLIKATEFRPLVIVAEDLHWADLSSIEFIESLFSLVKTQKILFVNVFRPGYKETGDRIVEALLEGYSQYYVEIILQSLDERMSQAFISKMLKITGFHHDIIDQIVQRSDGNPYFIEEVVRSLLDKGAIIVKDGSFEVTEKIDTVVIPHTINDVLMARIDLLEEKTRNLIKVASVIGRKFFYRILADVAKAVKDIDSQLAYLKDIQFIREQKRMEEIEYLFKHALAQEAAYESILVQKRKELHLKIANSIEKVFKERLHEFYGMLALHYSRGDDAEKAEEYLIRAGEEALRSSASTEALYYYKEALNLYLKEYSDAADPEKVAMLEKNIALALYNKGLYADAIEYFERALTYFGEKSPKHLITMTLKFIYSFFDFVISLYIPRLMWRKIPTSRDKEIINLFAHKIVTLFHIDPKRVFIESFYCIRRFNKFDPSKLESGIEFFVGISAMLTFSGLFFELSKRILELCKNRIDHNDVVSILWYERSQLMHNYYKGDWNLIKQFDDNLVNNGLNLGKAREVTDYILYYGFVNIYQGDFDKAQRMVIKLSEIAGVFDNPNVLAYKYFLNTMLLMKYGRLHEALNEVDEAITFTNKRGLKLFFGYFLSSKAWTQLMLKDRKAAEKLLQSSKEYLAGFKGGGLLSHQLVVELCIYLDRLEESITSGKIPEIAGLQKTILKTCRKAVKISQKKSAFLTESLRMMGTYYWITGKQQKALDWWVKSIETGEQMGSRLELSRTFFEVGKRLTEKKSKFSTLKKIKAEEYLVKARTMFEEMNLQWDLDLLERIFTYR